MYGQEATEPRTLDFEPSHIGYLDGVIDALPPGSRVQIIPGAAHFLQADQPEARAAILDYLNGE
ncbi:alpha/beta hydrolase [Mycobacterium asiaticum]|uniref:alpha/beta hydrolase n=1 Tax=Mycobacterium asiaticum TaxID=1790 RepID=UPI00055E2442|nr:alpha/beta hydrolase [Mycobacterium asiaticum]ORA08673.1 hypothetical protein BST16_26555 [Mycobacterium asiaticum DSM 44297]